MKNTRAKTLTGVVWRSGQAVMTLVIFTMLASLGGLLGFSYLALREADSSREIKKAEQSYYLSEAGLEDVSYRIMRGKQYASNQAVTLDGLSATTSVVNVGQNKEITAVGDFSRGIRTTKTVLKISSGVSFIYGIQVGRGGFLMENNSVINGSVYSGGNIVMRNNARINGDAFVASTSSIVGNSPNTVITGYAQAHNISKSSVSQSASSTVVIAESIIAKHAQADRISGSTVTGNAYYFTSIATSTVGGSSFPATPAPADLPVLPMPISDSEISAWEALAEAGGTHSSPCPYSLDDGVTSLGPLKINCDFTMKNDAVVILNGPLWVSGNFEIENDAILKLPVSYGENSEVVIVDNPSNRTTSSRIEIENNAQILGSGIYGSYIVNISQNNSAETGGSEIAVQPKNNATTSVFYASHGKILLENNVGLKEATAYLMHVKNNAVLNYETGLSDIGFSQGPSGGYTINRWKEVE